MDERSSDAADRRRHLLAPPPPALNTRRAAAADSVKRHRLLVWLSQCDIRRSQSQGHLLLLQQWLSPISRTSFSSLTARYCPDAQGVENNQPS